MTTEAFDLVVLGAGNAGQAAAGAARAAGWTVAIVEADLVGGVCPNRGCTPKKVLVAAAESLDAIRRAKGHAIDVAEPTIDWPALIARKRTIVDPLPDMMAKSLEGRGIELVRGAGAFVAENVVEIGDRRLTADKFVIATGSRPRPLSFEGASQVWTSNEFLSMESVPGSMLFIGAGVVSMEFAHVLARVGASATVLARGDHPLGRFDNQVVDALVEHSRAVGIDIRTNTTVNRVTPAGDRFVVELAHGEDTSTIEVDRVLNGAGRVANVDNVGLEHMGIAVARHKVELDEYLRSVDNPNVYFAGDSINGTPQLSPVATKEGRLVGHNLLNDDKQPVDHRTVPAAVFTIPAIARVGLTETEATARGLAFDAKVTDMREWISSRTYREEAAFAKVLVETSSGAILGADLLGHNAGDIVHVFALAMRYGIPASEVKTVDYAYPTTSNDVKYLV